MNKPHNVLLEDLIKKYETDYKIIRNLEYNENNKHGEIDLLVFFGRRLAQIELKTTHSNKTRAKAIKQLHRATEYIKKHFDYVILARFYITNGYCERIE